MSDPLIPQPHTDNTVTRRAVIPPDIDPLSILGTSDQVLRALEKGYPRIRFLVIGHEITLTGPTSDVESAAQLVIELIQAARRGDPLDAHTVGQALRMLSAATLAATPTDEILSVKGRSIRPKSEGQKAYVDAIERATVVFGIGPAGTGKTYLAMAQAVRRLLSGQVRRIVLTRPAVEAGENLGFLPGTLTEKIDPYLRPLYDALKDMLDSDTLPKLMAAGTIEVAPLAYMRGRTLNDSFIILDEAQNTTASQMKMFLTRLGFNSQVVVTGDVSQIDLPGSSQSGLLMVEKILDHIEGVEFCHLTSADVVRHELVGHIIDAYERWDQRQDLLRRTRTLDAPTRQRFRSYQKKGH
ncbi:MULTISPECIES: PhoH family protein [unclassified Schaalia]|uniref:PhoH family protein n=1 Tax=unclassified Schaalia TaxID=2691889 RepID=UPI001E3E5495|nr:MULTISPECIES: PhoH family protein [unclassified Schaalia]MCD4549458.1 PhoH family protein [Schaalia sp. lx-260]MCD4558019.1 PhoH family protein [Schaalia sp. lx-100]